MKSQGILKRILSGNPEHSGKLGMIVGARSTSNILLHKLAVAF